MSITPEDPIVPRPPAIIQQAIEEQVFRAKESGPRAHKLIPNAAVETLRQWDEYRAAEQAKYREMTPEEQRAAVLGTMGIPANDDDFRKLIASLPDLNERDRLREEAHQGYLKNVALMEEQQRKDNKWYRRLLRKIRSLLHLK